MADSSLQHHPFELSHSRTRQASTSSLETSSATEDKSTSSQPRRRRGSPSSRVAQSSLGIDPESSRRRGSKPAPARDRTSRGLLANMSGSSDPAGEVTYTPTTHRVSKAKKGKKVHVCEHPGCGKTSRGKPQPRTCIPMPLRKLSETFSESGSASTAYGKTVGVSRSFKEVISNLRRHEVSNGIIRPQSHRSTSEASSNPPSGGTMAPTMGQAPPVTAQAMSHGPGAMAITSIIDHPMRGNEFSHPAQTMSEISQTGIGPIPPTFRPEWPYATMGSADSPIYSSDSCSSPMSDYPNAQMSYLQRPPSTFSDSSFHQQPMASPLSAGPSYPSTWGPPVQLPFANVGSQWQPIRNESASPTTVALGQSSFLKAHNPQTQHYLDCYWLHFAPLFPIIHRPTFMSTIPQPLLAASMVVIGAQYSPRPDAKQYSASLQAGCAKMMLDRDTMTSRSSVFDLQIEFHLEMFDLLRARSAKFESIQSSPRFETLYASLVADQDFLHMKHSSFQQTLPSANAPIELQVAYQQWVEHEIRRRILVAMFILDTQHSHLLQRQPSYRGILAEDGLDLPFPTFADTWNCPDILTWRNLITSHKAFSLSDLGPNLPVLDAFQSSLLTCYQIHGFRLSSDPTRHDLIYQPPKSLVQHTMRTNHALALSSHIPLHALLITASESWLFGTKVTDEHEWRESKATLRGWITSKNAMKAMWHATQLLRMTFQSRSPPLQHEADAGGYLHDLWCLYVAALVCWAFGYGTTDAKAQPELLTDNAEVLTAEYLSAMAVGNWMDIRSVAAICLGSTRGLLEWVRLQIGDVGMGGLLNGAEDVLFRLVEGETGRFFIDALASPVVEKFGPFEDNTSNQAIAYFELQETRHVSLIEEAAGQAKEWSQNFPDIKMEELAVEIAMFKLSLRIAPYIRGFIHVQTNPFNKDSTSKTVENAKRIIRLATLLSPSFPTSRICIKIPSTYASLLACHQLSTLSPPIHTLATTLFTLPQALLAAEAKCTYIAPYVNELAVQVPPDIAALHAPAKPLPPPILPLCVQVQKHFRERGIKTKVLPASLTSKEEIMRLTGVDHITIAPKLLSHLAVPMTEDALFMTESLFDEEEDGMEEVEEREYLEDEKRWKEDMSADVEGERKLKQVRTFIQSYGHFGLEKLETELIYKCNVRHLTSSVRCKDG
ncbi:MAG: hypothetical protein Q9213_005585 [Squamulea squamosa]